MKFLREKLQATPGKGLLFTFSFSAVPTHPIFEYGHDAWGYGSPLVSSMRKWVCQGWWTERMGVWSLMTPEAAEPIQTELLPPEFCLCEKSNSYLFKPQWVKFSNIYSQNITRIYWCLSLWASFPLKEGVWPMWANIPFKQDGYIQIKAQEAGNLTANLAPSWCSSHVCSVLLGALKPPAASVVNTASFPLSKGALWYDLLITRPPTHH